MKNKIKSFTINDLNNPFKDDALNREEYATVLMQFFSNTEESLTLAINSGWGTGKTTFIIMLQQLLENKEFPTILFNAWENDYSDNALVSLIGEIISKIKEEKHNNHIMEEKITKQIVEDGAKLIKSIPHFIKLLTANQIDLKNLEKIQDEFSYSLAKNKLLEYTENKKDITQFKKHLQEYVRTITNLGTDKFKPLIFFIDELDRCRPNFTIELLEKLKHIFDIEGVIFVLSIDKIELEKTIKVIYGDIEIDGYLRKFIDFTYRLPTPSIEEFCNYLIQSYGFEERFNEVTTEDDNWAKDEITKTMSAFSKAFNFSLRKIEQCFSQLSIVLKTIDKQSDYFPIYTSFLICLNNYNEKVYYEFVHKEKDDNAILELLEKNEVVLEFLETQYGERLESYIRLSFMTLEKLITTLNNKIRLGNNVERDRVVLQKAKDINDKCEMFLIKHNLLDYLAKKIEITDNFVTE